MVSSAYVVNLKWSLESTMSFMYMINESDNMTCGNGLFGGLCGSAGSP